MNKALRVLGKVCIMIVGIIFLAIAIFEFLIIMRGEHQLFEDPSSGLALYLVRGFASLICFLLALSSLLFPKRQVTLARLMAALGVSLIVGFSYLLMETYLYIPLLVLSINSFACFLLEGIFHKKNI